MSRTVAAIMGSALVLLAAGCGDRRPPNIVLIVIDTLRADHLGSYGYHRPTSPHIDDLAARGALFERASSVAPYTRPSTASILTGLYPSVHGAVTHADSIAGEIPTLAERLGAAGYLTAGFHRNGNVSETFGFGRGFDSYISPDKEYWRSLKKAGKSKPGQLFVSQVDDSLLTRKAVPFIREVESTPFFLYLHLGGGHDPYAPPRDSTSFLDAPLTETAELFYRQPVKSQRDQPTVLRRMITGLLPLDDLDRRQIVDLYDGEVAFADRQIGAVLAALEESGRADDTLVVVTSDHGEEFWDHGGLGHGQHNYQELLHVPLVIAGPGIESRRLKTPVSLIDLTPTILDLAGLEPPGDLPGRSLAAVLRSRRKEPAVAPVYAEGLLRMRHNGDPMLFRSLQLGDLKLVLDFQRQRKELYDLAEDAAETRDLIADRSRDARGLLETLIEIHGRNLESPYLGQVEAVEVPQELEEQIRALGYLGDSSDSVSSSLFRAPLKLFDVESHGLMGHERDGRQYLSALDFSSSELPEEQLLYGWDVARSQQPGRGLMRKAGVRLKRESSHRRWRLRGRLHRAAGKPDSLTLSVRIDGAEPELRTIPAEGPFEISGPLAAGSSYLRLDLECDSDYFVDARSQANEFAYCLTADFIGLIDGSNTS